MKISGVKIRGVDQPSFRYRQWATIISIKLMEDMPSYKCIYADGMINYVPIIESRNYEIAEISKP